MRMSYQYSSLTAAVSDKNCPLRRYLDQRFPNPKPIQTGYRANAGTLLVDGSGMSPGTVGAAFDYILRFTIDPSYKPLTLLAPAFDSVPGYLDVLDEVVALAATAHTRPLSPEAFVSAARASWVMALCTELYRNPFVLPTHPLADPIRSGAFTADTVLALAPQPALDELRALYMLALAELGEYLSADPARVALGPTFAASEHCGADADLIVDGVLVELKTRLGKPNARTGVRSDSLALADIYQVLGYTLFDTHDRFGLHTVALYSARYGTVHRWPLQQLLDELAGEPVDLSAERAIVWDLLAADNTARHRVRIGL